MGKIVFEYVGHKQKIKEIYEFCSKYGIKVVVDESEFYKALDYDNFDIDEFLEGNFFVEDVHITEDTLIRILLPAVEEYEFVTIDFCHTQIIEAQKGELIDCAKFIGPRSALFYVKYDYNLAENFNNTLLWVQQRWGDKEVSISLTRGITSFGIRLSMDNLYDGFCPPVESQDIFIYISSNADTEPKTFEEIVEAYIFEIQSSLSLSIHRSERQTSLYYYEEESSPEKSVGLRPLMYGKGISNLIKIYNSCNEVQDNEYRILNYTKVIEYVSQTVIRKEMLGSILQKLYSPRALQPDATYILELEELYNGHRNNQKDNQAIKLTVETCCDLSDLIGMAPTYLKKFKDINRRTASKELKAACLEELASSISDTRNMIAHAKTNYKLKGNECPIDQLGDFAECLKVVAVQVIRWFARQPEDSRII
ncbi:hypothetical protein EC604_23225 [Paenibacillus amylolyticus]|uniref:ApeA N-terminal domain-containing protein n=1 Tax=Paenibacillus amylolyticus TaxID=1451 RepID=A0A5M9WZF7_PAEAM|nr:hypothetical protein [Paenibacillus amylolyticus]KAA8786743.1 hypothetical protein EC604_23225 [Paenibacillus amylolyticus]